MENLVLPSNAPHKYAKALHHIIKKFEEKDTSPVILLTTNKQVKDHEGEEGQQDEQQKDEQQEDEQQEDEQQEDEQQEDDVQELTQTEAKKETQVDETKLYDEIIQELHNYQVTEEDQERASYFFTCLENDTILPQKPCIIYNDDIINKAISYYNIASVKSNKTKMFYTHTQILTDRNSTQILQCVLILAIRTTIFKNKLVWENKLHQLLNHGNFNYMKTNLGVSYHKILNSINKKTISLFPITENLYNDINKIGRILLYQQ